MLPPDDLAGALQAALEQDPRPVPAAGDRLAAVMVPLITQPEPSLMFTVRAAAMSRHAGEISFPGGLQDPGETLVETVLREVNEELGLDPDAVRIVGALPSVHTFVSGILVVPFVGMLATMPVLTVSDGEIDELLTFPVMRLAEAEAVVHYDLDGGRTWKGFAYELDGATIWGATGWMLHTLLETIRKDTSWPIP
ncbi:MAG TPA: CoA pyrophosphatase [Actinomycetota bacterium]|nr:CoA pyrophosphatase [Actinomycetota bacterium]